VHNKQFIKITFHLAGQTGDRFALMSLYTLEVEYKYSYRMLKSIHVTINLHRQRQRVKGYFHPPLKVAEFDAHRNKW